MSRQLRTLVIGAVLCLVLGLLSFGVRVPYLVQGPGPTFNTLGSANGTEIISIEGHTSATTSGHLNLTTVAVDTQNTTIIGALKGWLRHDEVVVPRDSVYPPGTSQQQQSQQDAQDFTMSQDSATAAAACELGYPKGFGVLSVPSDSPNAKVFKAGDRFVSVAGKPATSDTELRAVLNSQRAGTSIPVVVVRAGKQATLTATLGAPSKGTTTPRLGVYVTTSCLLPFEVNLSLAGIGGPSAGLMFSLGIIDKLSDIDLTHGKFIAGTGTIDPSGAVGQIGGIQLKMIAARRAGATVFLAPASNCADVKGNIPSGLDVVKVTSLHDAVADLERIAQGQAVPHC